MFVDDEDLDVSGIGEEFSQDGEAERAAAEQMFAEDQANDLYFGDSDESCME